MSVFCAVGLDRRPRRKSRSGALGTSSRGGCGDPPPNALLSPNADRFRASAVCPCPGCCNAVLYVLRTAICLARFVMRDWPEECLLV